MKLTHAIDVDRAASKYAVYLTVRAASSLLIRLKLATRDTRAEALAVRDAVYTALGAPF